MSKTRFHLHIFLKDLNQLNFLYKKEICYYSHKSLFLKVVHRIKDSLKNYDCFYVVNKHIQ
jgi:hypothetical protein